VQPVLTTTQYANSGGVHIAYQASDDGPRDLVYLPGLWSHIEHVWRDPSMARFLHGLASFSRLITLDTRGSGLSDRTAGFPLLEKQIDDVLAVMDAVGSDQATIFGASQSGPLASLMAASHPDRVTHLVLYGSYATNRVAEDHPWGRSVEWVDEYLERANKEWGLGTDADLVAPSRQGDPTFREWWARLERYSNAPGDAMAYIRSHSQDDVRAVLPAISVPTLVMHRRDDRYRPFALGQYLADHIPGAQLVDLPGKDHLPYLGDTESILSAVEEFVTGSRRGRSAQRVLATVLFTDIVDSTGVAVALGDAKWRELLDQHNRIVREELAKFRGHEVNTAGDGFLATFDGPGRAIDCAVSIRGALEPFGVHIRAGIHTGEIEVIDDDIGGIGVHIGARVAALAEVDEVMVSRTVKDLVAGSGAQFTDRGNHQLKGIPEEWHLYSVST
jgi:class 3 adenylate cyclase